MLIAGFAQEVITPPQGVELQGYSYTGAAAMFAALGDGNRALENFIKFRTFLKFNTMYAEAGPVIETPLAALDSIFYMLLQSWDDVLKIFPATPDAWQDVSFSNLLATGGFLVSATRRKGITTRVAIKSRSATCCKLNLGNMEHWSCNTPEAVLAESDQFILLKFAAGQEIEFTSCSEKN